MARRPGLEHRLFGLAAASVAALSVGACMAALHRSSDSHRVPVPNPPPTSMTATEPDTTGTGPQKASEKWIDSLREYPLGYIPAGAMAEARAHKRRMLELRTGESHLAQRTQSVPGTAWRPIGPHPIRGSFGAVSGRIRTVAIDPSDPFVATFYIGGAQGGVWKTYNGGQSWIPLTDFEASLAMGSIAIDPDDTDIVYAGTGEWGGGDSYAGMGVLRSTNGGSTWTRFGSVELAGARIGKVAVDPTPIANPLTSRIVYVASNVGLFRSIDSGQNWTSVWTESSNRQFSDVVVDPTNPAIVYAGRVSPNGNLPFTPVYRSTSYGAPGSWVPIAGQPGQLPDRGFGRVQLSISATVPPVLVASMRDLSNGTDLKGIWKTSDGGTNWTRVTGHPHVFAENGWVASPDVAEAEPNDTLAGAQTVSVGNVIEGTFANGGDVDFYRFYVDGNELSWEIAADRVGSGVNAKISLLDTSGNVVLSNLTNNPIVSDSPLGMGVQGSDDERMSFGWSTIPAGQDYILRVETADGALNGSGDYQLSIIGTSLWCQCHYDQVVAVDPYDPDILYWGGIRLFRSTDGGRHWSQIQDNSPPETNWLHQDIHAMAFDPADSRFMLWTSDGGVWATTDRGDKWVNLNTNLQLTQFYAGISQHPTDSGFVLGGSQDNATSLYRDPLWSWPDAVDGDGGFTAIDPSDPSGQTWYFEAQRLDIRKTTDDGATAPRVQNGLGLQSVAFIAPFIMDPSSSQTLLAGGGRQVSPNRFENHVYRTTDGAGRWTRDSPHLGGMINALAFAPSDSTDSYFAGTTNGRVWGTRSGSSGWIDLTRAPLPNRVVTDIAVHPTDPDTVYVTFSGFNTGHVYRTTTGGTIWVDISSAPHSTTPLPNIPTWALVIDPQFPNTLYIGTDVGIFRTTDGGVHWAPFDDRLPNVAVFDLALNPDTGKFRAATHGRGMWELYPGNDHCLSRLPITDGTYYGSTTGTTDEGSSSCGSSDASPDVWFQYTAPFTGELAIDTCGSSFDTVLSIHRNGCPANAASQLAGGCNDDGVGGPGCGLRDSSLVVPVTTGLQYLIRVSGYNGASGDFVLNVESLRPPPTNDVCGSVYLPQDGSYSGWTRRATNDGASTCGNATSSPDVWYRYNAPCTGRLQADVCGADFDTVMSVHNGCPGSPANELSGACNDDCSGSPCGGEASCLDVPVQAGEDYYLRLAGYGGESGEFTLNIACVLGNDACSDAVQIFDGSTPFSTTGATTDGPSGDPRCDNAGSSDIGSDIWYVYVATCGGWATIDTCGSSFDTRLAVYEGFSCPPSASSLACNDDRCGTGGLNSEVSFVTKAGQRYLIRAGGFNEAEGEGTLNVEQTCALFYDDFETGSTSAWSLP